MATPPRSPTTSQTTTQELLPIGTQIGQTQWTITRRLPAGQFGVVYLCVNRDDVLGAMKTEPEDADPPYLAMELLVYQQMKTRPPEFIAFASHFATLLDHGRQRDKHDRQQKPFNFIVVSQLGGRNLEEVFREARGRFGPGTAIGASLQLLNALHGLHNIGYLHRDIKPQNVAIGRTEERAQQRRLYLLNFEMARHYLAIDGSHLRPRETTQFRGTPKYASINAHENKEYNREGDVESWFYLLVELYTGSLPWSGLVTNEEIGAKKALRRNRQTDVRKRAIDELLAGCPAVFREILAHIDGLTYEARPDYESITRMLRAYLVNDNFAEHPYDWET